jgi:hypothetical protein
MRSEPAAAVFAWVSAQPRATLYTTSVSKAEIPSPRLPPQARDGAGPREAQRCGRGIPSARVFAEHDPAAIAWSGGWRQRSLCPNPDLPCASRAADLLYAVGVHGRTGAPVPQIAAARAERMRSLDLDVAGVEREGIAAFDAVPLEGLQEEPRHRCISRRKD